ncbi:6-phosphogluconolactonase/glucosamine-6-phosphate isomerase/deaminase [Pseudomonas sp. TE36184]
MSGKPAHLQELSYPELIRASHKRLQELADRQVTVGKIGVIFIDGLNEAAGAGTDALQRLAALFPPTLSNGLVIVITGAGLDGHTASLSTVLQRFGSRFRRWGRTASERCVSSCWIRAW